MNIEKINTKLRTRKKLTESEETYLEWYENTHEDFEFSTIVGKLGEITEKDKAQILKACEDAIKSLGYNEIDVG